MVGIRPGGISLYHIDELERVIEGIQTAYHKGGVEQLREETSMLASMSIFGHAHSAELLALKEAECLKGFAEPHAILCRMIEDDQG